MPFYHPKKKKRNIKSGKIDKNKRKMFISKHTIIADNIIQYNYSMLAF